MPGGANAEEFRERLNLARRTQASYLRDVDAYEIDQAVLDQRHVFVLRVEQLAHGQRGRGLLPQDFEMFVFLGRERIFEEEEVMILYIFAELQRLRQRHALVNVVQKFDFIAEFRPQMVEQFGDYSDVRRRIPDVLRVCRADGFAGLIAGAGGRAAATSAIG